MESTIQLVECPRDAMQGWKPFIPTADKIRYLNLLLKAGFHTLDFGSFVSPKYIPQMADTALVLEKLDPSPTQLLAIVANLRGAQDAVQHQRIRYLGFPFSVSETFQQRNTHSSREEALHTVEEIEKLCRQTGKELVVYMSMGFGNPYGDPYSAEILASWTAKIQALGVRIISLADTVGKATPEQVYQAFHHLRPTFTDTAIGVHLHATPSGLEEKLNAALDAGCIRIDGAVGGIGGCPMADDELVGNMNTSAIIKVLEQRGLNTGIDMQIFHEAERLANQIFKS
jgi:hydroxymethylglutaryl-CoA lyase